MVSYSYELKMLMKDQLIQTLLLFEEDLDKEEIHGFPLIKECYGNLYVKKNREVNRQIIDKMLEYYENIM